MPSFIHSGISVFCMHFFISAASLSCMEINFLNQNPCMPSRPEVFQFGIFLSIALSPSGCMFTWGPSSSIRNSLFILFIYFAFFYLSVPIFCSKIFWPLSHLVVGMASPILPLTLPRIFSRCFWTSCFVYIVWSCLGIFLVFLLSLVFFGWSPQAFFEF